MSGKRRGREVRSGRSGGLCRTSSRNENKAVSGVVWLYSLDIGRALGCAVQCPVCLCLSVSVSVVYYRDGSRVVANLVIWNWSC
ncbi:unnamed protein product [Prunus armeniaca]|uniref:Uncharacterized protein n=1 Tax=Prunus armeniaca TaxID=36596 RepID=A0A6J5V133_PRUAR|nr:unnamed protein product [Prunus armeniaca]CAB4311888.1 unnamed protein product [Prunus armeniaca]